MKRNVRLFHAVTVRSIATTPPHALMAWFLIEVELCLFLTFYNKPGIILDDVNRKKTHIV
jgi:hypothetical protein